MRQPLYRFAIACTWTFACWFGVAECLRDNKVQPSCDEGDAYCSFDFLVTRELTLLFCQGEGMHKGCQLVKYDNLGNAFTIGKMEKGDEPSSPELNIDSCLTATNLSKEDAATVVTGDGSAREVMLVNGELPGPPIVVYENQEVIVNVKNGMYEVGLTMHWHGIHQKGTPWMDGAGGVSQCPINPGETFTYRFAASPCGTHWYHAHQGLERTEGVYGPLVVLPRRDKTKESMKEKTLDPINAEYHVMVQEWYQQSSFEVQKQWEWLLSLFPGGYDDTSGCFDGTYTPDMSQQTIVKSHSVIINGRGQYFPENGDTAEHPGLPVEVYYVQPGSRFLFRVTNTAMAETLRISIDDHILHVTRTEDQDVEPIEVQSVIISPGERYDFWTDMEDRELDSYWMRVEGISIYTREDIDGDITYVRRPAIHTEAIVSYTDSAPTPVSQRAICTEESPCKILNCPYKYYPMADHSECIPITSLVPINGREKIGENRNMYISDTNRYATNNLNLPMVEHFLHFMYVIGNPPSYNWISSVNGIVHQMPVSPPQVNPNGMNDMQYCSECPPGENGCQCTHRLHIPLDHVIYLVFLKSPHPVHFHGHSFEVVKIGFPTYDPLSGRIIEENQDYKCLDDECFQVTWANSSWSADNLPGTINPGIRKDTVQIPDGGYVVVRFTAHNPGFWLMHCHMQFHNAQGMALIVQEGLNKEMPAPPAGMDRCGDFYWSQKDFFKSMEAKMKIP